MLVKHKKRGRKRKELNLYQREIEERIQELREKLIRDPDFSPKTLTKSEKHKIRNQISAMHQRLRGAKEYEELRNLKQKAYKLSKWVLLLAKTAPNYSVR